MAIDSGFIRLLVCLVLLSSWLLLNGCSKSLYKTELTTDQKSLICSYSVPWDRQECLDQANAQIDWCKEALGQEDDCWNTLLGDYSRYRRASPVSDAQYFEILHDPAKISPLLQKLKRLYPHP